MALFRLALVWLLLALPVQAQSLFPAAPENATPETAVSEQDAAATLVDILRDDAARETLIRQLEAAAAANGTPENGPAATTPETEPEQMSLARQLAEYTRDIAEGTTAFGAEVIASTSEVLGAFTDGPAVNWSEIYNSFLSLALVGAVTITLFWVLRAMGSRLFLRMGQRALGAGWMTRLALIAGSSLIDALIILLAWQGGYASALLLGEVGSMDFRQSLFLNAFLLIEMGKVLLRGVLSPRFPALRFAPMSDETASYWYFWSSRLISLLGYGLLLVVPIVNAAVSFAVGHSLAVLIALLSLLIAVLIVLQNHAPVARALRERHGRMPDDIIGKAEAAVAGFWHWLAIAYLVALFVIWTARPAEALPFMLKATLNSVIAVVVGIAVMALISRAITGGMRLPEDVRRKLPLLEYRLNAFVPTILKVARVLVALAVLLAIAQAWQVMDFLGWVASEFGRNLLGRLVSAALVMLIAMAIWLAVSSFIEYRLNPVVGTIPTARERTLLALFRNAFTIALIIIAAMLTLSEIGVNIAPLLAGAGVLGLAIGFGAQKLVQDIITGAFIQFENAMNEGDVVTAGGITGVVEKLTIRSVGLRDVSGTYHLIPFSSVDMVSNFMKGFAFHVAEVGVAYRENVSEVKVHMQKAFDILQAGDLGAEILEPLDIQGVSALGDSAVVVRGRIKTKPGMQWAVGRAYNEIIKEVLDEAGVEIPFPHMTLYMGQNKDGSAPPLNLRREPRTIGGTPAAPALEGPQQMSEAAPETARETGSPATATTPGAEGAGDRAAEIERAMPSGGEVDED
ncbi:mechanosensitive ion channel domain-containing protein [Pararhodobacter sp.]|uniref:mechanosensitive ion channel domain-containing protein n=1 Tax=Pararhodobacter sp. TaxID=2127056 RepID=UPI002FDE5DC5